MARFAVQVQDLQPGDRVRVPRFGWRIVSRIQFGPYGVSIFYKPVPADDMMTIMSGTKYVEVDK